MKMIPFTKMHGAGNDFIIIDGRNTDYQLSINEVEEMCSRKTGIGADGLMILENSDSDESAFYMRFYNADGSTGAMCGNGGRCIARFAYDQMSLGEKFTFKADDGLHAVEIDVESTDVSLCMANIDSVECLDIGYKLNSGTTPHVVSFLGSREELSSYPILSKSPKLREIHNANINHAYLSDSGIYARTFERGVENETLACGTGACCIVVSSLLDETDGNYTRDIIMPGGTLNVSLKKKSNTYSNIILSGPTKKVFTAYYKN